MATRKTVLSPVVISPTSTRCSASRKPLRPSTSQYASKDRRVYRKTAVDQDFTDRSKKRQLEAEESQIADASSPDLVPAKKALKLDGTIKDKSQTGCKDNLVNKSPQAVDNAVGVPRKRRLLKRFDTSDHILIAQHPIDVPHKSQKAKLPQVDVRSIEEEDKTVKISKITSNLSAKQNPVLKVERLSKSTIARYKMSPQKATKSKNTEQITQMSSSCRKSKRLTTAKGEESRTHHSPTSTVAREAFKTDSNKSLKIKSQNAYELSEEGHWQKVKEAGEVPLIKNQTISSVFKQLAASQMGKKSVFLPIRKESVDTAVIDQTKVVAVSHASNDNDDSEVHVASVGGECNVSDATSLNSLNEVSTKKESTSNENSSQNQSVFIQASTQNQSVPHEASSQKPSAPTVKPETAKGIIMNETNHRKLIHSLNTRNLALLSKKLLEAEGLSVFLAELFSQSEANYENWEKWHEKLLPEEHQLPPTLARYIAIAKSKPPYQGWDDLVQCIKCFPPFLLNLILGAMLKNEDKLSTYSTRDILLRLALIAHLMFGGPLPPKSSETTMSYTSEGRRVMPSPIHEPLNADEPEQMQSSNNRDDITTLTQAGGSPNEDNLLPKPQMNIMTAKLSSKDLNSSSTVADSAICNDNNMSGLEEEDVDDFNHTVHEHSDFSNEMMKSKHCHQGDVVSNQQTKDTDKKKPDPSIVEKLVKHGKLTEAHILGGEYNLEKHCRVKNPCLKNIKMSEKLAAIKEKNDNLIASLKRKQYNKLTVHSSLDLLDEKQASLTQAKMLTVTCPICKHTCEGDSCERLREVFDDHFLVQHCEKKTRKAYVETVMVIEDKKLWINNPAKPELGSLFLCPFCLRVDTLRCKHYSHVKMHVKQFNHLTCFACKVSFGSYVELFGHYICKHGEKLTDFPDRIEQVEWPEQKKLIENYMCTDIPAKASLTNEYKKIYEQIELAHPGVLPSYSKVIEESQQDDLVKELGTELIYEDIDTHMKLPAADVRGFLLPIRDVLKMQIGEHIQYFCRVCHEEFQDIYARDQHEKANHLDEWKRQQLLLDSNRVNYFIDRGHEAYLRTCGVCQFATTTDVMMTYHKEVHHETEKMSNPAFDKCALLCQNNVEPRVNKIQFQCNDCKMCFQNEELMNVHTQNCCKTKYVCDKCRAIFSSKLLLQSHVKICIGQEPYGNSEKVVDDGEDECEPLSDNMRCDQGNMVFVNKETLNIHQTRVNCTEDQNLMSSFLFASKLKRKDKKQLKAEEPSGPHMCHKCGRMFKFYSYLTKHSLLTDCTQNKDKVKYPCEKCGDLFSRSTLKYHTDMVNCTKDPNFVLSQKQIEKYKKKKCEKCGRLFRKKFALLKHIRNKPYCMKDPQPEDGIYKCHKCDKIFSGPKSLKNHYWFVNCTNDPNFIPREVRGHNNQTLFPCKRCSKMFKNVGLAKRHMIYVNCTNDPNFFPPRRGDQIRTPCVRCSKMFKTKKQAREHMYYMNCMNDPNFHIKQKQKGPKKEESTVVCESGQSSSANFLSDVGQSSSDVPLNESGVDHESLIIYDDSRVMDSENINEVIVSADAPSQVIMKDPLADSSMAVNEDAGNRSVIQVIDSTGCGLNNVELTTLLESLQKQGLSTANKEEVVVYIKK